MKPPSGQPVVWTVCLLLACAWVSTLRAGEFTPITNPDFTEGDDAPAGWTLSGGKGRWVDRDFVEVTGSGNDSNFWRCDYDFTPGALYHFRMRARHTGGSGCVVSGPAFANHDCRLTGDWAWYGHVFRVPEGVDSSYLRLGQWQAAGDVQFDAVRLLPSIPVHTAFGELLLGEGESIRDGRYTFSGTFGHEGSNYHRTLASATATFNSDRWTFGGNSQVSYRFELPGHKFLSGEAAFDVNYHTRGECAAEVTNDGKTWHTLTTQSGVGTARATLPADLFPAKLICLRLKSSQQGSLQVNRIEFAGDLDGNPPSGAGRTLFADVVEEESELLIERIVMPHFSGLSRMVLALRAVNAGRGNVTMMLDQTVHSVGGPRPGMKRSEVRQMLPNYKLDFPITPTVHGPGKYDATLDLHTPGGKSTKVKLSWTVPDYYRADYGRMITRKPRENKVWWCEAAHKVPPHRDLRSILFPYAQDVRLSAARNDHEAVQIVVRPNEPLKGLTAAAGALSGPQRATIPAENVEILRVAYHYVHHPTDKTGVRDWWPDALPPLKGPIDVPAAKNQPLWVLVHVPGDAKAGDYTGEVALKAEGWSLNVPIKLHVWNFTLPKKNHIETAFGFSPGNVFRYHGLKTEEDKRRVLDMYLQNFADHRISPYDPAPMDPIGVKFLADEDPPRAELDFSAFDPAMTRVVEKFHFTGFRLPIQGMGGGSFHARHEPKIGRFGEDTPEYRAMFSSYVKQLEDHLREKGWLDEAYIYWFDEPAPKDYAFVANGMKRLKKHAPGLRRMLTEEPGENELAGTVDVWCPVSPNYNHEEAEKRRAHGERFWWYVCCGPKAPYCTLFIDHPATELRTWLWQTWQRDIVGVLVWQATYWTSSAAFPDPQHPQNPYEDPMGYVSGYSTPKGTKRYWGNGDGRFIYPPESAAVPGLSGPDPVIEPPVSSIRWEMLREGIEDYEYLYMLRELLAKKRGSLSPDQIKQYEALLDVPPEITRDMTTFTTDPAPIYARRAAIAEAIERLQP